MDISCLLLTLQSRLSQTEAKLAAQRSSTALDVQFDLPLSDLGSDLGIPPANNIVTTNNSITTLSDTTASSLPSSSPFSPPQPNPPSFLNMPTHMDTMGEADLDYTMMADGNSDWSNHSFAAGGATGEMPGMQIGSTNAVLDFTQISDPPSRAFSSSSSENRSSTSISAIEAGLLHQLHAKFFDVLGPVLPMIDQARFYADLAQPSPSLDMLGLSLAVAALGAQATPVFSFVQKQCYDRSREMLDMCEREERGGNLATINSLQTCILITFYELRSPNFARSWMSLGRAIRLCKMMGMDKLDADDGGYPLQGRNMQLILPPAASPRAAEERRRTFWVLYICDTSAAVRFGTEIAFDPTQISVRLPSALDLSQSTEESTMPSLQHIESTSLGPTMPPFAGTILVVSLYRRCSEHEQRSRRPLEAASYGFWVNHYRLDRAIADYRAHMLQDQPGALSLMLQMNLLATELWLHETALAKTDMEPDLPAALRTEATTRCVSAAAGILAKVQEVQDMGGADKKSLHQSSVCIIWPMTLAMRVFQSLALRLRAPSTSDVASDGGCSAGAPEDAIHVLGEAMRDLVPVDLIPVGLLGQEAVERAVNGNTTSSSDG